MPIKYDSQYWPPIGTESNSKVAKYRREKSQALSRQQIILLLLPTSATISLKLIQSPSVPIKPREDL